MVRATLAALVTAGFVMSVLGAPACVVPSVSTGEDAGAASSASGDAGTTAAAAATVKGASCTAVTSSISLCEYISSCPSLVLSPQFTSCGFYIHGSAIDPECLCENQWLCPIGHPTTCTQAAADSSGDVTYDSVCNQAVTGGCEDLTAGTGAGSTTTAACQTCVNNCDNVPSCIDACGC